MNRGLIYRKHCPKPVREGSDARLAELSEENASLRAQIEALEANLSLSEARADKNYQKLRNDEELRAKTRKALDIAMALLAAAESMPIEPMPGETAQGDQTVQSLEALAPETPVTT